MLQEFREHLHSVVGAEFKLEKHPVERLLRDCFECAEGIGTLQDLLPRRRGTADFSCVRPACKTL